MSKPSEWLPKTNKLFERWCFASPTPREILESFNKLETELADKDKQLAEARARIDHLERIVDEMTEEQAALCAEGQSITELVTAKDKLIEQMREALQMVKATSKSFLPGLTWQAVIAALAAERGEW